MLAQLFIVKCLLHTLSSHFVLIIQSKSKKHLNLHFNYEEGENGSCRSSQVLQSVSVDVFISLICSQIGIWKAYLWWNSKQNLFIPHLGKLGKQVLLRSIPNTIARFRFQLLKSLTPTAGRCAFSTELSGLVETQQSSTRDLMGYWDFYHQATLDVILLKRLH